MAYWPTYEKYIHRNELRHAHIGRVMRRAVIPGYLFVEGPPNKAFWEATQRIDDIVHIVRTHSGQIGTLRQQDIDSIIAIEAKLNAYEQGKSLHNFKTGDKVRFKEPGSLPPGLVTGSTSDGRLIVGIEMMGRVVPMRIFPHLIEKA